MRYYIGIDLGTTNSAISTYDGNEVRIWKSPEQNSVTPSAIYIDRRGNRYYGQKAYQAAPYYPGDSATLFKRYLGTGMKFEFRSAGLSLTPEECSAELLKILLGYLPEEIRNDPETAAVITVPAAFNQMKKDATVQAARLAGMARTAIMQEPVAAVMSIMKNTGREGAFLVYDLGGGTFDVSVAENIGGRVSLLAHGGREMCGGRDLDRMIFQRVVVPWMKEKFVLPGFPEDGRYASLCRLAQMAAERAKTELSSRETGTVALGELEARCTDETGGEVYLDIPLARTDLDGLLSGMIAETVETARETLAKAGLSAGDLERIVFVGGPTHYKPLRDKVAAALSVPAGADVDPMTAVAEGASIFAESIDWSGARHDRKAANAEVKTELNLSFRYTARTPEASARVAFLTRGETDLDAEIVSADTGWSSGRARLTDGLTLELPLGKNGENAFDVNVYDAQGRTVPLRERRIVITRTLASIRAIPASHSVGVEAVERLEGAPVLDLLVREGDALPSRGRRTFRAGRALRAGSSASINLKLWEGGIQNPITDNLFIGVLKIQGVDFASGVIPMGAEIECEYEMADSGAIRLEVSIPSIGASFGRRNFYSRQEGQLDLTDTDRLAADGAALLERIDAIAERLSDPGLERARGKAQRAAGIGAVPFDPEEVQKAASELLEAKKLTAQVRQNHLREIRQMDLNRCLDYYEDELRPRVKAFEAAAYGKLARAAQRSIDRGDTEFENQLLELRGRNFAFLWREDWFVVEQFNQMIKSPHNFLDRERFETLREEGRTCLEEDRMDQLRKIAGELIRLELSHAGAETMYEPANLIRG